MKAQLKIGTRGSPLALVQAEATRDLLAAAHPELAAPGAIEIVVFRTSGDRLFDRSLADAGGKGLFTKEIEEALLAGDIDLAVHCMKDVATRLPAGLSIPCYLPREDTRDAWLSRDGALLDDLPAGSLVGTAGLRRQAQILLRRPDLRVGILRGSVDTRIAKLKAGECDATLLAIAGLNRLGKAHLATAIFEPTEMLPAVAQGALGLQIREGDERAAALVAPLNCAETATRVIAERAFLAALDGSCRTPIAALAVLDGDTLSLEGFAARTDGRDPHRISRKGPAADAARLGFEAGAEVKASLPADFFSGP
jgi:hydroxymethylbilane synthase